MASHDTAVTLTDCKWVKNGPIAHRALHDPSKNIYENSLSAAKSAVEHGYAIEVDLQFSKDRVPMVFHDFNLERMTGHEGKVRETDMAALKSLKLGNSEDFIPTLKDLLNLVDGKSGLVLELKGMPGDDDGFVAAVARDLENYSGDVCIMSFYHHLLRDARQYAPHLPLGLTAEGDEKFHQQHLKIANECDVEFVSYQLENLDCDFAQNFRKTGKPMICWTVKNEEDLVRSNLFADQPTFEGFLA
ncbi:MAG: glycerophosphodiester phosphodiesterase family protein [Pseudomonadota bacterium]